MVGFGELRRRSLEWKQDLGAVERAYATDWLLKGVFEQPELAASLALRGSSALRYAYCHEYVLAESPEFTLTRSVDEQALRDALIQAAQAASGASSLSFVLLDFHRGTAKFDYAGPLGRRSAAQPHISLLVLPGTLRLPPAHSPLLHPFSDTCPATVAAVAFEEWIAGHIIALVQSAPRVRDVYDLWFALSHACRSLDRSRVTALVQEIASEKNAPPLSPTAPLAPHREALQRAWEGALRNVPGRPTLEQAETDLVRAFKNLDL